jgi:hypothetical protein
MRPALRTTGLIRRAEPDYPPAGIGTDPTGGSGPS